MHLCRDKWFFEPDILTHVTHEYFIELRHEITLVFLDVRHHSTRSVIPSMRGMIS